MDTQDEIKMPEENSTKEGTQPPKTFVQEERDAHKKGQRMHNSLGALLLGLGSMGGGDGDASQRTNSTTNGNVSKPGGSSNTQQQTYDSGAATTKRKADDYYGKEMTHWGETKKFEDDIDAEWLESEHSKMDGMFGEGIVSVKYSEQGNLGYYCEICLVMMNAMKPLEMHCSGMKHLKKKDIYEKKLATGTILGRRREADAEPKASKYSRDDKYGEDRRSRDERYPRDRYSKDAPPESWERDYNHRNYDSAERGRDLYRSRDRFETPDRPPTSRDDRYREESSLSVL